MKYVIKHTDRDEYVKVGRVSPGRWVDTVEEASKFETADDASREIRWLAIPYAVPHKIERV